MAKQSSINVLLINQSENESEKLVTAFRNAGRIARAFRVESAEELLTCLKDQDWDLLISDNQHPEVSTQQVLEQIKKLDTDLPLVAITDNPDDLQQALDDGAKDVVGREEECRLVNAAFREIESLYQRRQLRDTEQKLVEAEQRAELLLAESSAGVAYIADGMLMGCNESFCKHFGYNDPDDMDCMPVIDLIADSDGDKFKSLLKAQPGRDKENTDCNFTGVLQNGETFSAAMQLSNTVVDDETCIQISIQEANAGDSENTAALSSDSDISSYTHFLNQLNAAIIQAQNSQQKSALLFIGLNGFAKLREQKGLSVATQTAQQTFDCIKAQTSAAAMSQLCDDGFVVLLEVAEADKALEQASALCQEVSEQDINGQTVSACILTIDGSIETTDTLLDHAFKACHQQSDNCAAIYEPPRSRKALGDAKDDQELDAVLEEALEDDQFWLTFQPLINIRGASGDHYEVKTRMTDKDGNEVIASEFLQSLQFSETNTRLDRWILLQATKQLGEQKNADTRLLINITPQALYDDSLLNWLGVALKAGNFKPEALLLQFQEQDIVDDLAAAQQFAENLKETGCQLSISGFGNCNEPMKILNTIKPHYVRVHRNFTEELQNGGDAQPLKALVASIGEQNCKTVITGVDNASVMAQLWQLGVDFIQGNYLAPPSQVMDYEFTDIA